MSTTGPDCPGTTWLERGKVIPTSRYVAELEQFCGFRVEFLASNSLLEVTTAICYKGEYKGRENTVGSLEHRMKLIFRSTLLQFSIRVNFAAIY